ncbi:MAG: ATP-dependent Clp protease ATP-binding subunit ClpX [Eubacteriales bacterium]|nr:ATP-dependent Clp protease ATP-binding subunit ClpX [Eubacteriales bacterium]
MSDKEIFEGDFREVADETADFANANTVDSVGDTASGIFNERTAVSGERDGEVSGKAADAPSEEKAEETAAENTDSSDTDTEEEPKKKERYCMMCRRPERKTGKLIEMPGSMLVCQDCMQRGIDSMQNADMGTLMRNLPPNINMIDLSSLGLGVPPQDRLKKKREKTAPKKTFTMKDVPPPHKIKAQLDEYVIGQEHAKKVMAVGVYNHYKRILQDPAASKDGVEIEKSNLLMIGPTGSGKTYMVQTLARLLDVPLALTDATSLTEAGYIGDDIESVVSKLLAAADNDVERAEHGIIFIDEIDKLAKKRNASQRDVSGESVQQGLLKLLEGAEVEVPVGATNKNAMVPMETVNTKNILFICGGAFPDLEEIIKERLTKRSSMGFQSQLKDAFDEEKNILQKVTMEDLRAFGMIPEFLGRMPVVFALESLTEDMLADILKEPKNAILKQYKKLLELDEVKLTFEDEALHAIARKALERDTGARALRAIIEEFMLDIMYEIPKDDSIGEVIITKEYIEHTGGPKILLRGQN